MTSKAGQHTEGRWPVTHTTACRMVLAYSSACSNPLAGLLVACHTGVGKGFSMCTGEHVHVQSSLRHLALDEQHGEPPVPDCLGARPRRCEGREGGS